MVFLNRSLLLALALVSAPAAAAQTVDFEASPLGLNPNPLTIGGATFTTTGGFNRLATFNSTTLCASTSSSNSANCSLPLEVLFAGNASTISFNFVANNTISIGSDIGDVSIFSGVAFLGIVDVLVLDGSAFTNDAVSLTGFSNVTRIVITSTDFGGVLYDDFTFTLNAAVPEPSTWAMMLIGFGGIGYSVRRRRQKIAIVQSTRTGRPLSTAHSAQRVSVFSSSATP